MKDKFKILVSLVITLVAVGVLSISTYAATMFSMGEPTVSNGEVGVPVYLETTDYDYIGGYHFFITFSSSDYTYEAVKNGIRNSVDDGVGALEVDVSQKDNGRIGVIWAYGDNQPIDNERIQLCTMYFTTTKVTVSAEDFALRPREVTYIYGVGDTSVNSTGGGKAQIMDLSEAATYITCLIPKTFEKRSDWPEGLINACIENLYIAGVDESGNAVTDDGHISKIESLTEYDNDYYRVVIRLTLPENETKMIKKFVLLADFSTETVGTVTQPKVVLATFDSVAVENMNKLS